MSRRGWIERPRDLDEPERGSGILDERMLRTLDERRRAAVVAPRRSRFRRRLRGRLQNTLIVGASEVGQLVARNLLEQSGHGINVLGFVDRDADGREPELVIGAPKDLPVLVQLLGVERVIVAPSRVPDAAPTAESERESVALVRELKHLGVRIDVVGPNEGRGLSW